MTEGQRRKPANMSAIVATNQGRRELTAALRGPAPLAPEAAWRMLADGFVVVDTRSSEAYGQGHVPGAFHAHLTSTEFEQRVGWIVPEDARVILVTDDDAEAAVCLRNLAFIGLDPLVHGFVAGGMVAWAGAGLPVETTPQMSVEEVNRRVAAGSIRLLDVRERSEWDDFHVDGALFAPYTALVPTPDGPSALESLGLGSGDAVAVVCATGKRSSTAISLLKRAGLAGLVNVEGGMEAWKDRGLPMVDGAGRACVIQGSPERG